MSHPHVVQADRDLLDDHNLVDHEPAGDDPAENRTAPETQVLQHLAGTVRPTTRFSHESR